jgi:hypothetical protein
MCGKKGAYTTVIQILQIFVSYLKCGREDIVWFTFIVDEEFRKFVQSSGVTVHFDQFVMEVV